SWSILDPGQRELRDVGRGWDLVVPKARVCHAAVIDHHLFGHGEADALDEGSLYLALRGGRVDDRPAVPSGAHVEHLELTRLRVDLHLGHLGHAQFGEDLSSVEPRAELDRCAPAAGCFTRCLTEGHCRFAGAWQAEGAILEHDLVERPAARL